MPKIRSLSEIFAEPARVILPGNNECFGEMLYSDDGDISEHGEEAGESAGIFSDFLAVEGWTQILL